MSARTVVDPWWTLDRMRVLVRSTCTSDARVSQALAYLRRLGYPSLQALPAEQWGTFRTYLHRMSVEGIDPVESDAASVCDGYEPHPVWLP